MSRIREINEKLKRFDIKRETAKVVNKNVEFRQLLGDQMRLTEGIVPWVYSDGWYKDYKRGLSSYIGTFPRIDFFNTGKFHRGMFARAQGNNFFFSSRDSKTGKLTDIYGESILELNPDNLEVAKQINQRELKKKIIAIFQ